MRSMVEGYQRQRTAPPIEPGRPRLIPLHPLPAAGGPPPPEGEDTTYKDIFIFAFAGGRG
jgi:hypothetical protein